MNSCSKFEPDPISGCSDIQFFIFWGHLPLEVVFHWGLSSLKPFLTLVWSHELRFKIWARSDQWLLRYSYSMFGQFIFDNTHTQSHTHLSKCNSSLASAEIEILQRIGNKPRFFLSGKLGRARLTDLRKIRSVAAEIFKFSYFEVIFH